MNALTSILLKVFFEDPISNERKREIADAVFPNYMPDKGVGFIAVNNIDLALKILREHVGEEEFRYCPTHGFITGKDGFSDYYGKFEIEDLRGFFDKLVSNGVVIYNFSFDPQSNCAI